MKKGQVTIFIIVAILIVGLGVTFFVFRDNLNIGKPSLEIAPINTKIISCLESTSEEGINYVSLRGGYYTIPNSLYFSYFTDEVPYYYINSKLNIPSIARIESELRNYVIENLKDCINISSFEEQGFDITEGNLSVSINVDEDSVEVKTNYPLAIKKGEDTSKLKEFNVDVISSLNRLYDASGEIANLYNKNPGFVCLNCLEDASIKYNVEARATSLTDNNVIWFSVLDSETELNWRFVVEQ
jgi:hypothetical protein